MFDMLLGEGRCGCICVIKRESWLSWYYEYAVDKNNVVCLVRGFAVAVHIILVLYF